MRKLILYTRSHCHLCEDMHRQLLTLQKEMVFSVELRDVDSNPEWLARYDTLVPVLMLGNHEICHYHLDYEALVRALQ